VRFIQRVSRHRLRLRCCDPKKNEGTAESARQAGRWVDGHFFCLEIGFWTVLDKAPLGSHGLGTSSGNKYLRTQLTIRTIDNLADSRACAFAGTCLKIEQKPGFSAIFQ
jgi:hypothetical protein